MKARFKKHTLDFVFDAGTSRGVLKKKDTWYIALDDDYGNTGIGEAGPLKLLSVDDVPHFEDVINHVCSQVDLLKSYSDIHELVPKEYPSIVFALEVAWRDLQSQGKKMIFNNEFYHQQSPIAINGLVWMNDADQMIKQAEEKINAGYKCIKIKVGAIDFEEEKSVLAHIRKMSKGITLRLDANGAWTYEEALEKLSVLQSFEIHSIEQPIKPNQSLFMASLCHKRIIDIALDEELIGISDLSEKKALIRSINPQYIILKPTLLGGFKHCDEWIGIADQHKIKWWNTSALESNIGLNAICQYSYEKNPYVLHGLGTGMLYSNNVDSPLKVNCGVITYDKNVLWTEVI